MHDLPPHIYDELKRLAEIALKRERVNHTLQVTALAHEAFLKLSDQAPIDYDDEVQFRASAARSIRWILVDHARAKKRLKRGGGMQAVGLTIADPVDGGNGFEVVEISDLLDKLAKFEPRQAEIVELRFFGGLSNADAAAALDIHPRAASYEWRMARAWLLAELSEESEP